MIKKLDREDREILEASLKKSREEPSSTQVVNNVDDDPSKRPDITSKIDEGQELIAKYENVIALSKEIRSIIKDRSKDVKLKFNADQNISLRDSIRRVFGIDTNIVTLDMYTKCLELQEKLAEQDREDMRNL